MLPQWAGHPIIFQNNTVILADSAPRAGHVRPFSRRNSEGASVQYNYIDPIWCNKPQPGHRLARENKPGHTIRDNDKPDRDASSQKPGRRESGPERETHGERPVWGHNLVYSNSGNVTECGVPIEEFQQRDPQRNDPGLARISPVC
jgi:hypothetical protein